MSIALTSFISQDHISRQYFLLFGIFTVSGFDLCTIIGILEIKKMELEEIRNERIKGQWV